MNWPAITLGLGAGAIITAALGHDLSLGLIGIGLVGAAHISREYNR